jgi:hypothetical protein
MLAQRCSWTPLLSFTGIALPTMHRDILVYDTLFWHDRLPRCSERVIAGFGDRRLVEAVLGVKMLVVQNRVC